MRHGIFLMMVAFAFACKKEVKYIYQVQEVVVDQPGAEKPNVKKSTEYISIAYSDLFGKGIPTDLLDDLKRSYVSFEDVSVIEDLIIRNFLKESTALVPSAVEMRADVQKFVKNCYNQFYGREPSGQELWYFEHKIKEYPNLTPEAVYYSFLTSNEYRQF